MTESSGAINFFHEDVEAPLEDYSQTKDWLFQSVIQEGNRIGEINVIFCDDDYLLKLNQDHLEHNYFTDILTFQYSETPISGDLFISTSRVKENASTHDVSFKTELRRVIIHGVLHLLGYKDKSPKEIKVMREKEDEYLDGWDLLMGC